MRIGQVIYDNRIYDGVSPEEVERRRKNTYDAETGEINAEAVEIFNLIKTQYGEVVALQRLGVRAAPGAEMALNGEIIRIGRSGKYEVFSDLIYITSINVLSPHRFFFDFKY